MRIVDHIMLHALKQPDKTALVCDDKEYSYHWWADAIKDKAEEYRSASEHAIVFRASQTIDFMVSYFAIHWAGKVAVPLEADAPEAVFNDIKRRVSEASIPEGTSDVIFTSGTTGRQKGVIIGFHVHELSSECFISSQGFNSNTTLLMTGPLNHIGPLAKVNPTVVQGGTIYLIDGLRDLNKFYHALDYPSHNFAIFLVPANIRLLLHFSADRLAQYCDKIEIIETGAAPLAQSDLELLCRCLPNSRLYNTYASTEANCVTTYDFNHGQFIAGCLGKPVKHSHVSIENGLIVLRGPMLMSGYIGEPELTASTLRDGAIYTNDLGRFDENGMLYMLGRNDDIINVGGFKIAPTEVEEAVMCISGIRDCIVISAPHIITGSTLRLLYVTDDVSITPRSIAHSLKQRLETYKIPTLYSRENHIERTPTGKLNRKFYRE